MAENYVPTPEDIQRLLRETGGLNLAGQQVPDGSYGFYSPDFSYGSYKMPYEDPTYRSGFEYARTIAGGMPFEDVVAPGMSFSPEQPMGYTQADLKRLSGYRGEGPAPVMPKAPTKGTPSAPNEGFVQMPSAPQGVAQPTKIIPFLQDLDISSLPRYEEIKDVAPIAPSFFDFDVEEILKDIDTEALQDIDLTGINTPSVAPIFSQTPMNFTGLSQIPATPQTAPEFAQPNVEEIVSPMMRGKTRILPRGLFSL